MINKISFFFLFVLFWLSAVSSYACSVPPLSLVVHHKELVGETKTIVLARVVGQSDAAAQSGWFLRPFAKFKTIEVLRGEAPATFTIPNGYIALDRDEDVGDFNSHRDAIFWDKKITRQWNMPNCQMNPVFFFNRTYLLFLKRPHWRAYEEIRASDDLWLAAVKRLINDPLSQSGLTMQLKEWLSLSHGTFVGRIQSCVGPVLTVDEVLHGKFSEKWRYSNHDGDGYWPMGTCEIGQKFLIVAYSEKPSILPYYSASVFPIHIGQNINFRSATNDSEINVLGQKNWKIKDLRNLFGYKNK